MNPVVRKELEKMAELVKNLLTLSMTLGKVYICTNAMDGWVQHSAKRWMGAGVAEFLVKHNIPVISARAYSEQFPSDVSQWKTMVRY